jgi:hypothetical protein
MRIEATRHVLGKPRAPSSRTLNEPTVIPAIMFSWRALNLIVGWHKGALIQIVLRAFRKEIHVRVGVPTAEQRVRVDPQTSRQIEPLADTHVSTMDPLRAEHRG